MVNKIRHKCPLDKGACDGHQEQIGGLYDEYKCRYGSWYNGVDPEDAPCERKESPRILDFTPEHQRKLLYRFEKEHNLNPEGYTFNEMYGGPISRHEMPDKNKYHRLPKLSTLNLRKKQKTATKPKRKTCRCKK